MIQFLKIIFLFSILLTPLENIYTQIPKYSLQAKNFVLVNPNKIIFDIVLTHTDTNTFEYSGGQFFFKIPQSFGILGVGSGINSGFQYDSANGTRISNLPQLFIPRNPSVSIDSDSGISFYELRLAANVLPGTGNGLILPQSVSKLVIRMKLISNNPFNISECNLIFRDSCTENPVSLTRTKISAYIDMANTEITRCKNQQVNFSGIFPHINCSITLIPEGLYNSNTGKLNKSENVTAYLRDTFSPYNYIDSSEALIDSNTFTGNFIFSNTLAEGNYYIVIKNRNILETWSREGGQSLLIGNNEYDFTSFAAQAFESNMVLNGNKYCIYSGDINADRIIDIQDLVIIETDLFHFVSGSPVTDLTGDYIIDIEDISIADKNTSVFALTRSP